MSFTIPDFSNIFNSSASSGNSSFSATPGFNLNFGSQSGATPSIPSFDLLSTPSFSTFSETKYGGITLDQSNFIHKMKQPTYTDQARISSDVALKSNDNIRHNFQLPMIGDYAHNFCIYSNYTIKGINGNSLIVDCIANYIESVTLNINNNNCVFAKIDGFTKVENINANDFTSNPKCVIRLEFTDLPLLTKYLENGYSYQIFIKFSISPPMNYELAYDIMLCDKDFYVALRKEEFVVVYSVKQSGNNWKKARIGFRGGHIQAILK